MDVKQISIHRYELSPRVAPNRLSQAQARQGALIKVEFAQRTGYADLFSWPELGDPTLQESLESLKHHPLRQAAASLSWAFYEARAKERGVSLLSDVKVSSHKTMTELSAIEDCYTHAKIKISSLETFQAACEFMHNKSQIFRLDFNGLLKSLEEAEKFKVQGKLDFIEDPFTPMLMKNAAALKKIGAPVALDREETPEKISLCDVWVVKPVYFSPEFLFEQMRLIKKRIVVTSNMDHPLGQLIALHVAQKRPEEVHGLLTQNMYQTHAHSHWVTQTGTLLAPSFQGLGWGLDSQLEPLAWEKLC
jgi:O-succinylbenzoate synthase